MLPSGKITGDTIATLGKLLSKGDVIIDGGNTFYKDDIRRARVLHDKGIALCGCRHQWRGMGAGPRLLHDDRRRQGGWWIGLDPIFKSLAPGAGDDRQDAQS